MNRKPVIFIFFTVIALLLSSCASTSLVHVWKDEAHLNKIRSVLIIGVTNKQYIKRSFEDEFVSQFKAKGINAVAAFRVLPSNKKLEKEEIRLKAKELNIDTVLVSRLVERKTVETYIPPRVEIVDRGPYFGPHHHHNLHNYYRRSFDIVTIPGYTIVEKFIVLETNLYDAKTEEIFWSVLSETSLGEPSNKRITSLVTSLVANLTELEML